MKIFFISPVRQSTPESKEACRQYVEKLEKKGHQVHWPIRDTDQTDATGIHICDTNLRKILEADEVHVWYHETSTGIHFDLGGVYMLIRILGYKKKVVLVNKDDFKEKLIIENGEFIVKGGKSYLSVLNYLDKTTGPPSPPWADTTKRGR